MYPLTKDTLNLNTILKKMLYFFEKNKQKVTIFLPTITIYAYLI